MIEITASHNQPPPRQSWSCWLAAVLMLGTAGGARAQWLTQSIGLKSGWNAVFLHVDASYTNLNGLVGGDGVNPIQEVWLWNTPS